MNEDIDINLLYDEIFGRLRRPNIFSEDDEDYLKLRQEILTSKSETYNKKVLPFSNISIIPYKEYIHSKILDDNKKKNMIISVVSSILQKYKFFINVDQTCYASGFYDIDEDVFYISAGSLVACSKNNTYVSNAVVFVERDKFLDENCILEGDYYRVVKDYKCLSATIAACFVLGKVTTYLKWKTSNGKCLCDLYPDKFKKRESNTGVGDSISSSLHKFYIKRLNRSDRSCDASGYYDYVRKIFILLSDSILSLETTCSFDFTAMGTARRKFLTVNCIKEKRGYRLKKDFSFSSPGKAASYVLGRIANGWIEWKDEEGYSLDDVYRIIKS